MERAQARRAGAVGQQDPPRRGLFQRDHPSPGTARHKHSYGPQTMFPGPRSLPLAHLPHLRPPCSSTAHLASGVPSIWIVPGQGQRQIHRPRLPRKSPARVEEDQAGLAGAELRDGSGRPDSASLDTDHRAAQSGPARELISPFSALSGLSAASAGRFGPLGLPHFSKRRERVNRWFSTGCVILRSFPRSKRLTLTSSKEQVVRATSLCINQSDKTTGDGR